MASRSDLPRINQCRWNGKPEKAARAKRRLKPNIPRKLESVSIHPIYSIFLKYLSTVSIYSIYLQYISTGPIYSYSVYLYTVSIYSIYRSIDPILSYPILSNPILSYLSIYPILSIYISYLSLSLFRFIPSFFVFPVPCPLSFLPFLSQG